MLYPELKKKRGNISAKWLWDLIIKNAHEHAEPGIVFEDLYQKFSPFDKSLNLLSNPCSEYIAPPGAACLLASINLRKCMDGNNFDFDKLREYTKIVTKYLNNALEKTSIPIQYIEKGSKEDFRQIGIGFMGLADIFLMSGVEYGSKKGMQLTEKITEEMALTAWEESFKLSKQFNIPQKWNKEQVIRIFQYRQMQGIQCDRWQKLIEQVENNKKATNSSVLSIAPTGSISLIAGFLMGNQGISSGIEPIFSWKTYRNDSTGSTEIIHDLVNDINNLPQHYVTANDLDYKSHIDILSAAAKFVCLSISKTVNLPYSSTIKDVDDTYKDAYLKKIKGITVYRDKSRPFQILSLEKEQPKIKKNGLIKEKSIPSIRHKVIVEGIPFYIFISTHQGMPHEVFAITNHKEDTVTVQDSINKMIDLCMEEKIEEKWIFEQLNKSKRHPRQRLTRLISLCLRHGVCVDKIINALENSKENSIVNLPAQIANKLKQYKIEKEDCPECGEDLTYHGGCQKCTSCSYVGSCG